MARPRLYDDTRLLGIMAELMAWPEIAGVISIEEAIRRALGHVLNYSEWPKNVQESTIERLRQAFREDGAKLIAKVRERPYHRFPLMPTLLGLPADPRREYLLAQSHVLEPALRRSAAWLEHVAEMIAHSRGREIDPDVIATGNQVMAALNKVVQAQGQPPIEEWEKPGS